jgi:co-chaperonin GroES (HSP10)
MKPIGKYIIITPIEEQIKTDSGLLLSDDATTFRYKRATVVKVGSDVSVIADNDEIYYDRNAGHAMIIDGETYHVIAERDVILVYAHR